MKTATTDKTTYAAETVTTEEDYVIQHRWDWDTPQTPWRESVSMDEVTAREKLLRHAHAYAPGNIRLVKKITTTTKVVEITVIATPAGDTE